MILSFIEREPPSAGRAMQQIAVQQIEPAMAQHGGGELSLEAKCERVTRVVRQQYQAGRRLLLAFSGGKDSSVMAALTLNAVRDLVTEGEIARGDASDPFLLVVHSNTGVENPVLSQYGIAECRRIKQFAAQHDLPVGVDVVTPNLSNDYLVSILGGRTVATLPGMGSACSQMMKVDPITRHKNRVFKAYGRENVVTLIGKRADESTDRAANMAERGESAVDVAVNEQGDKVLSPLADFTMNDVFAFIGKVRGEQIECYSSFDELVEHYRDMNGGDCMVSVYATGQAGSTGCGARSGCWTCLRVQNDTSMENLIADERYAHLAPLNAIRHYLGAQHWNPAKRNWLARTVDEKGRMKIAPNAYSPDHCRDLLRMVLSVQADEERRSQATGEPMRFQLLDERQVVAIQFLWSRYGYFEGAEALRIWNEIMVEGARFPVPDVESAYERKDFPKGAETATFCDGEFGATANGFRDVEAAGADMEASTAKASGAIYAAANTADEFDVDLEAACNLLDYELDVILEKYSGGAGGRLPVALAFDLLRMGVVTIRKGSESTQDRMIRMANQIERTGIRGVLDDPQALVARLGTGSEDHAPAREVSQLSLFEADVA